MWLLCGTRIFFFLIIQTNSLVHIIPHIFEAITKRSLRLFQKNFRRALQTAINMPAEMFMILILKMAFVTESSLAEKLDWQRIDEKPELYQPANVSQAVWPDFVTKTIIGEIPSLLYCCAVCNKNQATCNAIYFDDSGQEPMCQLSNLHQWRIIKGNGKPIYINNDAIGISTQNENGVIYMPKLTQFQLRTHMDPGSDGDADCWLYLRVCLEDRSTCCDSDVFDNPNYDDYERGNLDTFGKDTGMGPCYNFEVLDFRTAHIYMRQTDIDDWAGQYINLWFEDKSWFVKCVNPDGSGKIYLGKGAIMELECSPGNMNDP